MRRLWTRSRIPKTLRYPSIAAMTVGGSAALIAVLVAFLLKRQYQGVVRFAPEMGVSGGLPASVSGLAAQLATGFALPGLHSLQYYSVVLRSDKVVDQVLDMSIEPDPDSAMSGYQLTLREYLTRGKSAKEAEPEAVRKRFRGLTQVTQDNRASTMEIAVTLPDAAVAARVADNYLIALNNFNTRIRSSQARERRKFLEAAVAQAQDSLRQTEDALQSFLESNRSYQNAPALQFRQARIRRRVDLLQQVVASLQAQLQAARIDEINETPVITVIDSASVAQRPISPRPRRYGAVAFLVTGLLTLWATWSSMTAPRPRPFLSKQVAAFGYLSVRFWTRLLRRRQGRV